MAERFASYAALGLLTAGGLVFLAWETAPDLKFNPASLEDQPLEMTIAPREEALTLAQFPSDAGETVTMLVTAYADGRVTGVDLASLGAPRLDNPFAALQAVDADRLRSAGQGNEKVLTVDVGKLSPAAPHGERHVAVGTNFPEHAEEAASDSVFLFPKFGTATPPRTTVHAAPGGLLDYEVELCMRFDRPIETLADFDGAVKGVFLCADFTDRAALLRLADPDDLDSGYGFSDAKSGEGYFPAGPFLAIPTDWASFVSDVRMTTDVNGEPRQDARGREMILDFRGLAEKSFAEMNEPRFFYRGEYYTLAPDGRLSRDMTLMSGTSEGVIFTTPTRRDYIAALVAYIAQGGPLSGSSLFDVGVQTFIDNEIASGHYLQPGDRVAYRSSTLGDIVVEVTAP